MDSCARCSWTQIVPNGPIRRSLRKRRRASAFDGSYGYCGRYEIDAKHDALVHLPEVSTGPDYVATRQVRPYRFEGNRMTFSNTVEDESEVASWKIVWEKVI